MSLQFLDVPSHFFFFWGANFNTDHLNLMPLQQNECTCNQRGLGGSNSAPSSHSLVPTISELARCKRWSRPKPSYITPTPILLEPMEEDLVRCWNLITHMNSVGMASVSCHSGYNWLRTSSKCDPKYWFFDLFQHVIGHILSSFWVNYNQTDTKPGDISCD